MASPEDEELARGIAARLARSRAQGQLSPGKRAGLIQPQVPVQDLPDVRGAEDALLEGARENFALATPGPDADVKAVALVDKVLARPPEISPAPSFPEQVRLSLSPRRTQVDRRPPSVSELLRAAGQHAAENVALVVDPFKLNPLVNELITPTDEVGLPNENGIMWAMRVLGTAAPAIVQETLERLPTPDVTGAADALVKGTVATAAERFFERSTLGEQLLDVKPGDLQRVPRNGAVANWAQSILEKIERGEGLETEFQAGFERRLGPEWSNTGWWAGLVLDTVTNWEGALLKGPRLVSSVGRRAVALGELAPNVSLAHRAWTALRDHEIPFGEWLGGKLSAGLERGDLTIDQIPPAIRARMEEVAWREHGVALDELLETSGFGRPASVAIDPAYDAARRAEAEARGAASAAKKEARGQPPPPETDQFAPRRQVVRVGPRDPEIKRSVLPDFGRPINSVVEFWEEVVRLYRRGPVPELGWDLPPNVGFGFRRFARWHEQTIDASNYVLRSQRGDVVAFGTLDEVIDTMLGDRRRFDGDEIWWGSERPVARWSKTGDVRLTSDWLFSSPAERDLIRSVAETDARARPGTLKAVREAQEARAAAKEAARRAGRTVADLVTDAPDAARTGSPLGSIVEAATDLAIRDRLDSSTLRMLPNGALASPSDHARILRQVDERIGISQDRAAELIGGVPATEKEAAVLDGLAARFGITRFPTDIAPLTTRDWLEIRNGMVGEVGRHLADVRYRVEGTRPFLDRMFGAVQDLHLDRRKWGRLTERAAKFGPAAFLSRAFLEDKLGRLPPAVRSKWKELGIRLERNSDDFLKEYKSGTGPTAGRLLDLVRVYTAVHPHDLTRAERMADGVSLEALAELAADWRGGPRPRWLDHPDELVRASGALGWARAIRETAADGGRAWVKANLVAAGQSVTRTTLAELVDKLPEELVRRVYRELYVEGRLEGEALVEALRAVNVDVKLDGKASLVIHALQMRAEGIVAEVMAELFDSVTIRHNDPRKPALVAVLHNTHRTWNVEAGRWDYRYPEAQITWAMTRLRDWGIDPGAQTAIAERTIGRHRVALPAYLADDLARMVASAKIDSRTVTGQRTLDILLRAFKEWTTHGVILPNPPYFLGQMLSQAPTLVTSRGLGGATADALTLFRHPVLAGQLLTRLAGSAAPVYASRAPAVLRSANGALYSVSDLEFAARRHGLQDTAASFETAERLQDVIASDGEDYAILDPRRILTTAAAWQNLLRGFAGSFDQAARIAVFLREAENGAPLAEAAETARKAALDFRALTPWESTYMRRVVTFYAFMRKNGDAYIKALFHHPERVLAQMRLAHASIDGSALTDLELGALTNDEIARLTVYDDDEVVNDEGRPHPLYRLNRLQSTPLGVAEWLGTMRMLMGLDMPKALQSLNPLAQTLAIIAQGAKLDRGFDSARANRIPPVLLDSPIAGPILFRAFGVGPTPLEPDEDLLLADDDATLELGSSEPAVWTAGGDRSLTPAERHRYRAAWQAFTTWFSRPIGTFERGAEALGFEPHPPQLTQSETTLAFLLGLQWRSALAQPEVVRRAQEGQVRELRQAERDIAIPDRTR